MAQYMIPDAEELMECPYDSTHMIRAKRFPYHLKLCEKNHPETKLSECPFNACHRVKPSSFKHHIANCPDKCKLQGDVVYQAQQRQNNEGRYMGDCSTPAYNNYHMDTTEDWDSAPGVIVSTLGSQLVEQDRIRQHGFLMPQEVRASEQPEEDAPMRLPKNVPAVLQQAKKQVKPAEPATTPVVFQHSLSLAGIGRGMKKSTGNAAPAAPTPGVQQATSAASAQAQPRQPRMAANFYGAPSDEVDLQSVRNQSALTSLSRGRGIGRGQPLPNNGVGRGSGPPGLQGGMRNPGQPQAGAGGMPFVVPVVPQLDSAGGSCTSSSPTPTPSPNDAEPDAAQPKAVDPKDRKKIEKKLRQIALLEEKQAAGEKLNEDEKAKLAKKAALEARLK